MFIPQLRDDRDRVQTRILGQCGWDDLESFGECLITVCFFSFEGLGVLCEESGDVDFGCTATCDKCPKSL